MAKRKREEASKHGQVAEQALKITKSSQNAETSSSTSPDDTALTVQVITGSYERVLHGFTAAISSSCFSSDAKKSDTGSSSVQFVDTFLFEAHASAIRCLALSLPPKKDSSGPQKLILASGGTDERINLYSLSASPTLDENHPSVPTLAGNKILENPKNRELGSLLHHSASISALYFPSHSKLLAAAEDNTISVTRTRDFTVVSTIKAPRPKAQGRPTGDTAPPGGAPSGVNDFAVHPSMKLMLSVGRGEKCMRLWNLVTGKKAGVLNFSKDILQSVNESKWSTGEGRKIVWNSRGEEFAVAFEWGAVVFGIDSVPVCRLLPSPRSKLHQIKYVDLDPSCDGGDERLVTSTEDGRIIFFSTKKLRKAEESSGSSMPYAETVAQLGGKQNGLPGRVKDFKILSLRGEAKARDDDFLLVTAGSDGTVRVWMLNGKELSLEAQARDTPESKDESPSNPRQVGRLLNSYETGNRITCLKAFVMLPPEDASASNESLDEFEEEAEESSEDEESDDE